MLNMDELAIIRMYREQTAGRRPIMDMLKTVLPHFTEEEEEMKALTHSALRKLTAMTDQAFDGLDFSEVVTKEDSAEE